MTPLLEGGVDANCMAEEFPNPSPMFHAMMAAQDPNPKALEACKLLLAHGADLNLKMAKNATVLFQASINACGGERRPMSLEILKWMLENGADPKIKSSVKASATHMFPRRARACCCCWALSEEDALFCAGLRHPLG